MKKLNKSSFAESISDLEKATSVRGKIYHSIRVENNKVRFIRTGKSSHETIDLEELYELYLNVSKPTNTEAKAYISGRVQSPSVSIINALDSKPAIVIEQVKEPSNEIRSRKIQSSTFKKKISSPQKDETRFFLVLADILGASYLLSKSIGKPISASDVFYTGNFKDYQFDQKVEENFVEISENLKSNFSFSSNSLAHYIDGLSVNHPQLGSRIIEFDEEQHFTPALHTAMKVQEQNIPSPFFDRYIKIMEDLEYLNKQVLPKHRIKNRLSCVPENYTRFISWLADVNEKSSGYIETKNNGFPHLGGRIAQRAYYDCLRNAAHLSAENTNLESPLRFAKKYFENATGRSFNQISEKELKKLIIQNLKETYGFRI